jgi:hypothetical protein
MADIGLFWDFASGSSDSQPETASVDVGIFWGGACAGLPNRLDSRARRSLFLIAVLGNLDTALR